MRPLHLLGLLLMPAALLTLARAETSRVLDPATVNWGQVPKTKQEYVTQEEPHPQPSQETLRPLDVEPPRPQTPTELASDGTSDLEELARQARRAQAAYAALNSTNPLSDRFNLEAVKEKIAHAMGVSRATLEHIASPEKIAALSKYAGDPHVETDWRRIVESPIRSLWIWVQVGWVAVFYLLRAWRLAVAGSFLTRMFERMWLTAVFLGGSLVVIPWTLFGSPYYRVVTGAVSVLFG